MLQCRFCQASLLAGQKFCDQCGKPAAPPMVNCGECGQPSLVTAKFCGKCGALLSSTTAISPEVASISAGRLEPSLGVNRVDSPLPNSTALEDVSIGGNLHKTTLDVPHLFMGRWTEQQLRKGLKVAGVVAAVGVVGMLLMIQLSGGEHPASEGEKVASVNLSAANGAVVQAGALAPGADQPASKPNPKVIYQLGNIPSKPKEADASGISSDNSAPVDANATNSSSATSVNSNKDTAHTNTEPKPVDSVKPAKATSSHDAEVDAAKKAMNDFLKQQQQ